ncbi:MAG: hypothetical protein ACRDKZ_10620 [Actinomycetota bacterium]
MSAQTMSRGKLRVVIPASVVVLAMFVAAFFAGRNEAGDDPAGELEASVIEVGDAPFALVADDDRMFVSNAGSSTVMAIDVSSGEIVAESDPLPGRPAGLVTDGADLWVGSIEGTDVYRLDAGGLRIEDRITVGPAPATLARSAAGIWVAALNEGVVALISEEGEIDKRLRGVAFPSAIGSDDSAVYVVDVTRDTVTLIDVARRRYADSIEVGRAPTSIDVGDDAVWIGLFGDEAVARVDGGTGRVTTTALGGAPGGVSVGRDFVWVTLPEDNAVVRIDPETFDVVGEPIAVGANPQGVSASSDGSVWIANEGDDSVTRLRPSTSG